MTRKTIDVYYARMTPESAEEGDYSETGELESLTIEPDEYDQENGITAADLVVKLLKDEGAVHPSNSHFNRGTWYMTESQTISYRTGEEEERSFHLKGFTEKEEREIFDAVTRRRR
jgi:hypothetical protein